MCTVVGKDAAIAVSIDDLQTFGCPYCGYRSGYTPISGYGTAVWVCGECGKTSCVLAKGLEVSRISFGSPPVYPKLVEHPRKGIPAHGALDTRPEHGEFFRPREIGSGVTPGCFVCGGPERLYTDMAGFVQCKDAGERVVKLFEHGAWLDYREYEPDRVQVKIGACDTHVPNLKRLYELVRDAVITPELIKEAQET